MDTKERIKRIQKYLGVDADGVIGPATLTAAELKIGLIKAPPKTKASVPAGHNLSISSKSLNLIVTSEISSEAYYNNKLARPTWPGGASGVTVGIGYDLGYNTRAQIEKDWGKVVGEVTLSHLKSAAGIKGSSASGVAKALGNAGVKIDYESARRVFADSTLPRFSRLTRKAWPGVEKLPYDAQGALLSLIFNRGSKLTGNTRVEMKNIQALAAAGDLNGIASEIVSMKRLWKGKGLPGLLKRRDAEAKMVRNSKRTYTPAEIINV